MMMTVMRTMTAIDSVACKQAPKWGIGTKRKIREPSVVWGRERKRGSMWTLFECRRLVIPDSGIMIVIVDNFANTDILNYLNVTRFTFAY